MQDDDDGLLLAIEQTVDALTFAQTHVIDNDFRAHSKTTVDSVMSLQDEQRSRVDLAFRAIPASPQYLATLLLQVYRGEAASVNLARENDQHITEGGAIDDLSDMQCKAFKKEMKQRIHEWEGAFREANGREAAPQDKVILRPIYELYKHAKNRVTRVEAAASTAVPSSGGAQHRMGTAAVTPSRVAAAPSGASFHQQVHPTPERATGIYNVVTPASNIRQSGAQSAATGGTTSALTSSGYPHTTAAVGGTTQQQQQSYYPSPSTSAVAVAPTQPHAAHAVQPQLQSSPHGGVHHVASVPLGHDIPLEELIKEKRNIKRLLHQFEASFEQRHGRKPTKDDRREYSREYHRYGELKAILNEQAKVDDH